MKVELIDRNAVCKDCYVEALCEAEKGRERCVIKRTLEFQPVVDAVPVVRCKDCKHKTEDNIRRMFCSTYRFETLADFYCAHGEKMEGSK